MHEPAGHPHAELLDRIQFLLQQPVLPHCLPISNNTLSLHHLSSSKPKPGHLDEGLWPGIG
jgi:hypothetical protein